MKLLKNILLVLLALFLLIILVSFFLPSADPVERSVNIDAPGKVVFAQVNDLKKWEAWQPWAEMDSTMKMTYPDQTEGKGGSYSWTSEISEGGKMEITESLANKNIKTAIDFGMMGRGTGNWDFEEMNGKTKVSWSMQSLPAKSFPANIMGRYFLAFNDMDAMVGPDFEKGLAKLKTLCETLARESAMQVEIIDLWGTRYAAVRDKVNMKDIQSFYTIAYARIMEELTRRGLSPAGPPSGIYFTWDEANSSSDMAAAFPVSPLDLGTTEKKISIGEAETELYADKLVYSHLGSYEKLGNAHDAIGEWIATQGKKQAAPVIEEYITDPMAEPDTSKWLTRIIYAFN
jgi:effector-binding domain-containing protein